MNARLLLAALITVLPLVAGAQTAAPKAKPKPAAAAPKPAPETPAAPVAAPVPAAAPVAAVPVAIGSVTLVTGVASVQAGGQARNLGAGDALYEGQVITVGPNSYANLKFNDGGRVLLRPNTEFAVESFRYTPPPAAPAGLSPQAAPAPGSAPAAAQPVGANAFFRLVRGGFRAVTGFIGKGDRAAYRVTTPAATIGIRGTDYEVQTCADDCPTQASVAAGYMEVAATSLAGLELAQAGASTGGGIIVATNEGSIVLRTSRGETVVDVGQVALALANGQTFMLPAVPDALLLNATPAPADCE